MNAQVEQDVRGSVRKVFEEGSGVLTGGATGVDFFAMDESVKIDPSCRRLRVIIPAYIEDYIKDCEQNWCQAPVTAEDIRKLAELLRKIREVNPASMLEMPYRIIEQKHYDLRNLEEVTYANEVYAFQVNKSTGTQHTIDSAKAAGHPIVEHRQYTISE